MKTNDACSCVSKRVAVVDIIIIRIFTNIRLEAAAVATECVYQSVTIHDVFSESWCLTNHDECSKTQVEEVVSRSSHGFRKPQSHSLGHESRRQ